MNKLEEILNLKPISTTKEEVVETELMSDDDAVDTIQQINSTIDLIDAALPMVRDLEASDKEMDDIATLATDTFNNLIELSMNVEPRFTGAILQSASTILGHAVTAKTAKIDKKLRMIDLQLKKLKIDKQESGKDTSDTIEGTGMVLDRNELLKMILANKT